MVLQTLAAKEAIVRGGLSEGLGQDAVIKR
jgi:hypothetical protein